MLGTRGGRKGTIQRGEGKSPDGSHRLCSQLLLAPASRRILLYLLSSSCANSSEGSVELGVFILLKPFSNHLPPRRETFPLL